MIKSSSVFECDLFLLACFPLPVWIKAESSLSSSESLEDSLVPAPLVSLLTDESENNKNS